MSRQNHKDALYTHQSRAYIEGVVEQFNEQWVFFNLETEEASLLDELANKHVEIYYQQNWEKGYILEKGQIRFSNGKIYFIKDHDYIRFRKKLFHSFDTLLSELNDDSFVQFVTTLNSLNFSIYDCIYCYNHYMFLNNKNEKVGVNFMTFDNENCICAVQHHFSYNGQENKERFEFTLNTGKRMLVKKTF